MKIDLIVNKMFIALGIEITAFDRAIAQSKFGFIIWSNPPDEKLKRELATVALLKKPVIFVVKKDETLPDEVRAACNIIKEIVLDQDDQETFKREVDEAIQEAIGTDPFVMVSQDVE